MGVYNLDGLNKAFFKNLQKIGFYRLQVERPNEIVCAKFIDASFETKTHFIHIVEKDKVKWHQMLFFRDYLNTNAVARAEYAALKQSFFQTDLQGVRSYTEYKEKFIQSIFVKMGGK